MATTFDSGTGAIPATQDSGANAANTIVLAAAGVGQVIRLWKITVDTSGAAAAPDTSVIIQDDAANTFWKRFLNATRGPQWTEEFYNFDGRGVVGIQSRANKSLTITVAAAGASCITTLNILYDIRK